MPPRPSRITREAALRALIGSMKAAGKPQLDAIAHRIVHGGDHVSEPAIADDDVVKALDDASRFAPLHNPPAIVTLRAVREKFPKVPSIVVTDTAFHRTLPPVARTYAIPRALAARTESIASAFTASAIRGCSIAMRKSWRVLRRRSI